MLTLDSIQVSASCLTEKTIFGACIRASRWYLLVLHHLLEVHLHILLKCRAWCRWHALIQQGHVTQCMSLWLWTCQFCFPIIHWIWIRSDLVDWLCLNLPILLSQFIIYYIIYIINFILFYLNERCKFNIFFIKHLLCCQSKLYPRLFAHICSVYIILSKLDYVYEFFYMMYFLGKCEICVQFTWLVTLLYQFD